MNEFKEREKQNKLKEEKERTKTEFKYKLDTEQNQTYEDFVEDQIRKYDKLSKSNKLEAKKLTLNKVGENKVTTADDLFLKYNI